MDISPYLNQTGSFEKRTGEDSWGKPTFDPPVQVRARVTTKHKLVKGRAEVSYVSVTEILTQQPLALGDRWDGEDILAVENFPDFDGSIAGWTGFMRPPTGFTA